MKPTNVSNEPTCALDSNGSGTLLTAECKSPGLSRPGNEQVTGQF
jgi:hypothetical protein